MGTGRRKDGYRELLRRERNRKARERYHKNKKSGCYIATAVYGSYDCPQVWMLRRYRDNILDTNFFGRMFINIYYAFSPTLIRLFGQKTWFTNFFRKYLDKKIIKLYKSGFSDKPYVDR